MERVVVDHCGQCAGGVADALSIEIRLCLSVWHAGVSACAVGAAAAERRRERGDADEEVEYP